MRDRSPIRLRAAFAGALAAFCPLAHAQLRVVAWNISNYGGGRQVDIERVIYASFEGRSMRPDVILGEEFLSQAAVDSFRTILNNAPGTTGDWASAPFIDGADTDGALFYRVGRVQYLGTTVVAVGSSSSTNQPRNTYRYDLRPVGYTGAGATLACYASHMKAGSAATDQARRLVEAQRIRADAAALAPGWHFLLGGDFNIQSSTQEAYQTLVGALPSEAGRFVDPIVTPGSWNNAGAFRFVHTQDPSGAGGMDDRYDQVLVSASLYDAEGFDYVGSLGTPYSTTTWDDPNHSYRAWGNDGTSFNLALTVTGNQMVGPTIAQALINAATSGGHLPVFLDLRVPPKAGADASVTFGTIAVGSVADAQAQVWHNGDLAQWAATGLADLAYSFEASSGFGAPAGAFAVAPGGGASHTITLAGATPGVKTGTVTVHSNDPDEPSRTIAVSGLVVVSLVPGDANGDQIVNFVDLNIVLSSYGVSGPPAEVPGDLNADGHVNFVDLNIVLSNYGVGT